MGFYNEWFESINTEKEIFYIKSFLNSTPQSLDTFLAGNKDELIIATKVLLNTPISKYVETIDEVSVFAAEDIVQFSNFNHAISTICTCCEFEDKGLTFSEIGKMIMHSRLEGACKKYGENHAKLAAEFSLVTLHKDKSFYVKNTALGSFSISLNKEDKNELIKRLALRNCFIKDLLFHAKKDIVHYSQLASKVLSESTVNRRKSNVKYLTMLVLTNESLGNNIIW